MYDYGDGEDYAMEDDDKVVSVPVILSQPRIIQSAIGQDIILPCSVDNLPGNTSQISQRELKGLWEACSGFVTQLECALNNQDIYEEYVPQPMGSGKLSTSSAGGRNGGTDVYFQ